MNKSYTSIKNKHICRNVVNWIMEEMISVGIAIINNVDRSNMNNAVFGDIGKVTDLEKFRSDIC